ncbi:NIPSNAP family protein [Tahibacter sp. UC22_41]|uniref:NIPSNAP family protein n=1 Tax=Tahibacter sp. UC22_41 TaxID=3350178 RepID=UPI0036D7A2C0
MTLDTAFGTPHGAPIDYNWLRLLRREETSRTHLRLRPGTARLLRAFGVLAAVAAPAAVEAAIAADKAVDGDTHETVASPAQAVIELRQYTLHPGQRDTLIDLFERHFVESQEAEGMRLLGQFRDLDDPDRYVWLRSFSSMVARQGALQRFYAGPVWKAHRDAANATMIDSDNVLLLRPADAGASFDLSGLTRPAVDAHDDDATALVVAHIHYLQQPATPALLDLVRTQGASRWRAAGAQPLAMLVSEYAENTFPALPVRRGEHVLVTFTAFDDAAHHERAMAVAQEFDSVLQPYRSRASETLRLQPTRRSLLR